MIEFGSENLECGNHGIFIKKIIDDEDNNLKIIVTFSQIVDNQLTIEANEHKNSIDKQIQNILKDSREIVEDENNKYLIEFEQYNLYEVKNESNFYIHPDDMVEGNYFIKFKESELLNRVKELAWIPDEVDNYKHYGICALNHIVEILTEYEPIITKIS